MKKKKDEHTHKYKKVVYKPSGHVIFRCVLAGCGHFINEMLLPGRFCICWICNSPFTVKNTMLTKPHCDNCTKKRPKQGGEKTKIDINIDKLTELLI